ncbi:Uncharacterised protein [Moraxella equi]|uniref:Uncharacterized protein n=1 Tax=Moraxella equi TaxID=60442 RepID=A0A378QSM5_9GAMM|nr:hypothetical protein B5J93_00275 [Moraxella equi]STZ03778.1 Uncharacterised protein [Moraxella equi]
MIYLVIFIFYMIGFFLLAISTSRHQSKFQHLIGFKNLKIIGLIILIGGWLPIFFSLLKVYFVMNILILSSVSAGIIYIGLVIHDEFLKK